MEELGEKRDVFGGAAACSAGASLTRTAKRRAQRAAYAKTLRAKLFAVCARRDRTPEVQRRLDLVAPVLSAGLQGQVADSLVVRRRNAALHSFNTPVRLIEHASSTCLNSIQRGHRRRQRPAGDADAAAGLPPLGCRPAGAVDSAALSENIRSCCSSPRVCGGIVVSAMPLSVDLEVDDLETYEDLYFGNALACEDHGHLICGISPNEQQIDPAFGEGPSDSLPAGSAPDAGGHQVTRCGKEFWVEQRAAWLGLPFAQVDQEPESFEDDGTLMGTLRAARLAMAAAAVDREFGQLLASRYATLVDGHEPPELSDREREMAEDCLDSTVRPYPCLKRPLPLAQAVRCAEELWDAD